MNIFESSRSVLVGVDIQNDFIDGSLAVSGGQEVIAPFNRVATAVRQAEGAVALTRDWHPAKTPHFTDYGGIWPAHCIAGTEGAAFHPLLDIQASDIIVSKGVGLEDGYSGYEGVSSDGTTIEQLAQPRNPRERVIVGIGGLATDYCVLNTVIDAAQQSARIRDAQQGVMEVYALIDTMRAVDLNPGDEQEALSKMEAAGAQLVTTQQFIGLLS